MIAGNSWPPRRRSGHARVRRVPLSALVVLAGALLVGCSSEPSHQGRPAEEWIAQLETSPDSLQRRAAADALGRILEIKPGSERVTAALVRALADTSDEVRLAAGTALVHDYRLPSEAIAGLVRALADSAHEHTREHAADLLANAASVDAMQVTTPLISALADPEARVRDAAVRALTRLARAAPSTVEALRNARDGDRRSRVREGAHRALHDMGT